MQCRKALAEAAWSDLLGSKRLLQHCTQRTVRRPLHSSRYHAHLPEPPGVRAGHISGAVNLPAASLLSEGRFLPPAELRARFAAAGVDLARPMVVYCMTGIQAATVALAAQLAAPGARCAVYDGGWSEWGRMAGIASMAVLPSASSYN